MPIADITNGESGLSVRGKLNDVINVANASGAKTATYATAIKFDGFPTVYSEHTLTGATTFTINSTGAIPGATAILRLVGNGSAVPDFTAFKHSTGSSGWDGRVGILNIVMAFYDGANYWYTVFQEQEATPTPPPYETLQFPTRQNINLASGIYSTTSTDWLVTFMLSNKKIPSGQTGWFGVELSQANEGVMLGFNTSNSNQGYDNQEFFAWANGASYFRGFNGGNIANAGGNPTTSSWFRLWRDGSAGTVKLQTSADSGDTWSDLYTYPTTSTADLFLNVSLNNSSVTEPFGNGVVNV